MLSSFTNRFHDFVWFLIFTFTLSCMPHLELLFPYRLHFFSSTAHAQTSESTVSDPSNLEPLPAEGSNAGDTVSTVDKPSTDSTDTVTTSTSTSTATATTEGVSEDGTVAGIPVVLPETMQFTGSAAYRYPIAVAPGRANMSPQISLVYNSQQRNSWVGAGWTLDMGAIQRNTKWGLDYSKDGRSGDLHPAFVASINGSSAELIYRSSWDTVINGNTFYGYEAQTEGALHKYLYNPSKGWIVISKDGTKYYYGTTSASRQTITGSGTFKWCLYAVFDTNNNYMVLSYTSQPDSEIHLSRIDYTGNGTINVNDGVITPTFNPTHYVTFTTESRTDAPTLYTTNSATTILNRLKNISVYANGIMTRKYELAYKANYSPATQRSLLETITLTGYDKNGANPAPLPATTFEYTGQPPEGVTGPSPFITPIQDWQAELHTDVQKNFVGDFNGDGKQDVAVYDTGTNIRMHLSTNEGFIIENWSVTSPAFDQTMWVGDFDGDGVSDIARRKDSTHLTISFGQKDGHGFARTETWLADLDSDKKNWVGDFNGDGKTDLMAWEANSGTCASGTCVRMHLSDGTAFRRSIWYNTDIHNSSTFGVMVWLGDFNGDGKTDVMAWDETTESNGKGRQMIMHISTCEGYCTGDGFRKEPWKSREATGLVDLDIFKSSTKGVVIRLGDYNGDGKTDVLARGKDNCRDETDGCVNMYLSTGTEYSGFAPRSAWPAIINLSGTFGFMAYVGDFNGDGMTDVAAYKESSGGDITIMHFSTGSSFNRYEWTTNLNAGDFFLGDFDGDGKTDIVSKDGSTAKVHHFDYNPSDLLGTVKNSIGGTYTIQYSPSSDYPTDTHTLPFEVHVVSSVSASDGRGSGPITTKYSYFGGYHAIAERDFRGFRHVEADQMRDSETYEAKSETWFLQDAVLKGMTDRQLTTSYDGHTREVNNTWTSASLNSGAAGCIPSITTACFPRLDQTVTTVTDAGATPYTTTVQYQYDPTYLTLKAEHKTGDPSENPAVVVRTYYTYTADDTQQTDHQTHLDKWILSKPTRVTAQSVNDSQNNPMANPTHPLSRKWMDYNGNGSLTREEVCKSDNPVANCLSKNATQNPWTSYDYNHPINPHPNGTLWKVIGPRGFPSYIDEYDSTWTYVTKTTNAAGHVATVGYDTRFGKVEWETPPYLQGGSNHRFYHTYDNFGRLIREDSPGGSHYTNYYYDLTGGPLAQNVRREENTLAPNGQWRLHTSYTYFDGLGRTYQTRSTAPQEQPQGTLIAVDTEFDSVGRVLKKSNPYFYREGTNPTKYYTTFIYDGLSRVINTNTPDNQNITTYYEGLSKTVFDQRDNAKTYTYDTLQRLKRVTDCAASQSPDCQPLAVTEYIYDTLGNLTTMTAAKDTTQQNITSMTYDSIGKKSTMSDPDMGFWQYGYDKAGNLTSQTDAKNQTITFEYDPINRVTLKTYVGTNPLETVTYTYDVAPTGYSITCPSSVPNCAVGMLTSTLSNSSGETKQDRVVSLDIMQRVTESVKTIGSNTASIQKTYDGAGVVHTVTYLPGAQNQREIRYTYGGPGNLLSVYDLTGARSLVTYSDFTPLLQPQTVAFGNGVTTTYHYNEATRRIETLFTQRGTDVYQNLSYIFDPKGNLDTLTDSRDPFNIITYEYVYDELDRLKEEKVNELLTQEYRYDLIGNITYKSDVGDYAYRTGLPDCAESGDPADSNKPHAVCQAGNISLRYDKNGNMTRRAAPGLTLTLTWTHDNKPETITKSTGGTIEFSYDGIGQRAKKVAGSVTTRYYGELYEEKESGPITTSIVHIFANSQRTASFRSDDTTQTEQYYHPNHLGSASVVTDAIGDKKEKIEYYPFGTYRERIDYDASFPNVNYTFTDQEDDDEIGLYNYDARLYDPVLGRFISADSIVPDPENSQALNRYSYCQNNPLVYTDPSGHFFWFAAAIFAGALFGAGMAAATGQNIALGALTGAISGAAFFAAGSAIAALDLVEVTAAGTTSYVSTEAAIAGAGIHAIAGAASGAINTAITGGNVGMGALTGGISAGTAEGMGNFIPSVGNEYADFGIELAGRSTIGGITGGITAEMYGGNFGQGFKEGAMTAAAGFLFNRTMHDVSGWVKNIDSWNEFVKRSPLPGFLKEFLYTDLQSQLMASMASLGVVKIPGDMLAKDWLAKNVMGKVLREFPSEYLDKTANDILSLARTGDAVARKAWKLLTSGRFAK